MNILTDTVTNALMKPKYEMVPATDFYKDYVTGYVLLRDGQFECHGTKETIESLLTNLRSS